MTAFKELKTPYQVMEGFVEHIRGSYLKRKEKTEGAIQFHLRHNGESVDCYLAFDLTGVRLSAGVVAVPNVVWSSSLYYWIDVAAKRSNPVFGALTGQVKFKGDISFFSKVMPEDGVLGVELSREISRYDDPVTDFERNPHRYWKVPRRIFVLNASPQGQKGYTDFYLRAFVKGLGKTGAEIETVYLREYRINHCAGCWRCWLSGTGQCIFDGRDDFERLHEKLANADLIVYAFPLYVDGMPGALKDFLDRSVAYAYPYMVEGPYKIRHPRRIKKQQAAVVFSVCGFLEMENFAAVRAHFKQMSHNGYFPIAAEIFRPAAIALYNNPLLYQKLNAVYQAIEKAGEEVVTSGAVSKRNQRIISQRISSVPDFCKGANYFWREKIKNKATYY